MDELLPQTVTDVAISRRRKMKTARRDESGFSVDALPHLTAQQTTWILTRATVATNAEANAATMTNPAVSMAWLEEPDFLALYTETMENKREGFKQLTTQLLPQVLLALQQALVGDNAKASLEAAKLLLRNQGLLIDKVTSVDKDALAVLLEEIRRPRQVIRTLSPRAAQEVVDGSSRDL